MRWLSTLISTITVTLVTYFWAVPYFGGWFGLSYLPLDKQSMYAASMMALVIISSCLIAFLRRPTIIFTIMAGGAGVGAASLISLATKTSNQPLPPQLIQGGAIIGALVGFCLALGTAIATLLIILVLEQWLIPKFSNPPERLIDGYPRSHSLSASRGKRHRQMSPLFKWAMVLLAGIILIPISKKIDWPLFGTPSLNPHYTLTPSVWEGAITYKNAEYTFTLVFEEIGPNGNLIGYMDWPPQAEMGHSRLVVEGTANGNHLEFEDTDHIIGNNVQGSYDKKDVWISGNRMTGTDKNGTATLKARRATAPPPSPDGKTAIGFRANQKAWAAAWGKYMRVCQDLGRVEEGKMAGSCWMDLAKEAKEVSFCSKASEQRDQLSCFIEIVWETGDWTSCQSLGSSHQIGECTEAAITIGGNIEACQWYQTENNPWGASACHAVAKRDPEACTRLPAEESLYYQAKCWTLLAIALKQPQWCEQLPSQYQFKSSCYEFVKKRLHADRAEFLQSSDFERCQSMRSPLEQDACHLKLVSRGALPTLCSRIQNQILQGTCTAIQSL